MLLFKAHVEKAKLILTKRKETRMNQELWNDNIVYQQKGNLAYLQFKKLLEYPEITHCYTLRSGDELNFVPPYRDQNLLKQSYHKISDCLSLDETKIVKPHQTHTDRVENATKVEPFEEVDGLITNKANLVLLTTSADCTSLLFYDPVQKVIASVHSGWRGTLKGIAVKAVQKMVETYQCRPQNIICCLCPCIRQCCFEVEEDVKKLFQERFENSMPMKEVIKKGAMKQEKQKYFIDTTQIIIHCLKQVGLKEENIVDSGICTVCHSNLFHSYRAHKENSGRNAALICRT